MLQRHDEENWIQKLLPYAVGFFLFVMPAIRAVLEARKQQREKQRRAAEAPLEQAAGDESEGRSAWERLERGEELPGPPPLPPTVSRRVETRRVEERSLEEEGSLEDRPLAELGPSLPSASLPQAREGAGDEEAQAEELVLRREREEFARQEQVAAAEYAAASPLRSEVAPVAASAVAPEAKVARPARRVGRSEQLLFPASGLADRRAELRRAILLREVLGRPVSMRE